MIKSYIYLFSFFLIGTLSFIGGFLSSETAQIVKARLEREAELQLKKQPPIEIARAFLKKKSYWLTYELLGTIEPWRKSNLVFGESGVVAEVKVDIGHTVYGPEDSKNKEGQLLATLDLRQLEAAREESMARLEKLSWDYKRIRKLLRKNIESSDRLQQALLELKVQRALHTVAMSKLNKAKIFAPYSGKIAMRHIEVGEGASPMNPAFQIIQTKTLKVIAQIPEYMISKIQKGGKCLISVDGLENTFEGKIWQIAPSSGQGHFFRTEIRVENPDDILRVGMITRIKMFIKELHNVYTIPLDAIIRSTNYNKIMLVKYGKVYDIYYDSGLFEKKYQEIIEDKLQRNKEKIYDLPSKEWKKLVIPATQRLKAFIKNPKRVTLKGNLIKLYHYGYYAKSRRLKNFLVQKKICVLQNEIFSKDDQIIVRGQHRVTDGSEVVIAKRNELRAIIDEKAENVIKTKE